MAILRLLRLSPRPVAATAALLLAAACRDGTGNTEKPKPKPTFSVPADALAAWDCTASVQGAAVACTPASGAATGTLELTTGNASSSGGVFAFDAAIRNLRVFKLGTPDGASVEGVTLFFAAGPTTSAGSVDVRNGSSRTEDGQQQSFFTYGQVLALGQSASQRWEFTVSGGASQFTFRVYAAARVLPVVLFDRVMGGNRDVYRVALDGSDLVRLTTHAAEELSPTTGGGKLVYISYRHGNAELYSMPLTGGVETRLTTSAAFETDPALNPQGTRLAYASDVSGVAKVYVANADGSGGARATPANFGFAGAPEASPAWFPGQERLALVGTPNGTADVFDLPSAGATPALLRGGQGAEVTPAFSPDRKMLSYTSTATGDAELYVLTLATGAATRLTNRAGTDASGTWAPDGRIVYLRYDGAGNELRWINPATGAEGVILAGGASSTPILRPFAVPF